jgi:transposase
MDNVAFHKSQEMKKLIEIAGYRVLFLFAYSPDLNPIEQVSGNIKKNVQRMLGKMKGMKLG